LSFLSRKRNIDRNYLDYIRISTLELVSKEINDSGKKGAVAELGVYKGKFAKYINGFFPKRIGLATNSLGNDTYLAIFLYLEFYVRTCF
jgi:hypothetical protein